MTWVSLKNMRHNVTGYGRRTPNCWSFKEDMKGLKSTTISRHLDNVDFYINMYLLREDAHDFTQWAWMIDGYLGYFFIRKCMWSTPGNIKSTVASIKKFYRCMLKHEMIQEVDYEYLCETIK